MQVIQGLENDLAELQHQQQRLQAELDVLQQASSEQKQDLEQTRTSLTESRSQRDELQAQVRIRPLQAILWRLLCAHLSLQTSGSLACQVLVTQTCECFVCHLIGPTSASLTPLVLFRVFKVSHLSLLGLPDHIRQTCKMKCWECAQDEGP